MSKDEKIKRDEEFVLVWQTSDTLAKVSEHFGITKKQCTGRAMELRYMGIPLKKFEAGNRRPVKNEYGRLAELAKSLIEKQNNA